VKIIVVDDENDITQLTKIVFELYDHEVVRTGCGRELFERLDKHYPVDALLLDVMLPEIDGYDICRKLRTDIKYKNLPIVMISARNNKDYIEQGYAAGADLYMVKPFDFDLLVKNVEKIVKNKSGMK
jgi:DNA-binding response OmpR family regulator